MPSSFGGHRGSNARLAQPLPGIPVGSRSHRDVGTSKKDRRAEAVAQDGIKKLRAAAFIGLRRTTMREAMLLRAEGANVRESLRVSVVALVLIATACSRRAAPAALAPTAAPRIVYVMVTQPPDAELVWTPEPEAPTPAYETAVIEHRVPSPVPTIDIAAIPNQDRPRAPTPDSRTQQIAGCLTYSTEHISQPGYSGLVKARVRVRARNNCNFFVPVDDSWFEIVSTAGVNGSTLGREVGRFQIPIPPLSRDTETTIEVDCPQDLPGGCRFTAAVWWAAGGGRSPE